MSERPADVIVEAIKENMILRAQLKEQMGTLQGQIWDLGGKLDALERHGSLLETNLKRALIQEIESEAV